MTEYTIQKRPDYKPLFGKPFFKHSHYVILVTIPISQEANYKYSSPDVAGALDKFKRMHPSITADIEARGISLAARLYISLNGEEAAHILIESTYYKLIRFLNVHGYYLWQHRCLLNKEASKTYPLEITYIHQPYDQLIIERFCPHIITNMSWDNMKKARDVVHGPFSYDFVGKRMLFRDFEDCVMAKMVVSYQ